eukprot:14891442-Alexandrium_andersonii.AAC.1
MCIRDSALPRQFAPEAKAFPMVLASVQRTLVPARNTDYYHRLQQRLAKARLLPLSLIHI